ncbi:hypothetical protein FACS189441_5430 [Betaproteobacteria bacterium]|nr:hypothetical protein FACS189441_5430 [Betaproteobacteria bacterium]
MIYLITGLPGNGKTLYTLWHVKDRAEKENRPVFYSGIPELNIPEWHELEKPEEWFDLPPGAIIVVDEAQSVFRPRPGRGEPPVHVSKLETHRHDGHDLYLITQHPALIDQNVRRLTGVHRHIVRTFGLNRAVIHEWGEVRLDCERRRADSSKTNWNYPRNVYSLYKSAEVHTHKRHVPKQVWYLVICLAVLGAIGFHLFTRAKKLTSDQAAQELGLSSAAPASVEFGNLTALESRDRGEKRALSSDEYIASFEPRIPGLPHTAPRYDELTMPTDAPYPVGCYIIAGSSCKCVTQQGTPFKSSVEFCENFLAHGFFKDWGNLPAQTPNPDRQPPVVGSLVLK